MGPLFWLPTRGRGSQVSGGGGYSRDGLVVELLSAGNTGAAASWTNTGSGGNNAVQATSGQQPQFVDDKYSRRVLRFDSGSSQYLSMTALALTECTFFIVTTPDTVNSQEILSTSKSDSYFRYTITGDGYSGAFLNSRKESYPASPLNPTSETHIYYGQSNSAAFQTWIDGQTQGSVSADFNSGDEWIIGSARDATGALIRYFEGDILCVLIYNRTMSPDEISATKNILSGKFNVIPPERNRWVWDTAPIMTASLTWEGAGVFEPRPIQLSSSSWIMSYTGGFATSGIGIARSTDGIMWTKQGDPILTFAQRSNLVLNEGILHLFYSSGSPGGGTINRITSSDFGVTWSSSEVLIRDYPSGSAGAANSGTLIEGSTWYLFVECNNGDPDQPWRIFISTSTDGGVTFGTLEGPISALCRGPGGTRGMYGGPCIQKINGVYNLWYHASFDGPIPTSIFRAISPDLVNWTTVNLAVLPLFLNPNMGDFPDVSQVADVRVFELIDGTCVAYFDQDDNTTPGAEILRATFIGSLSQLVQQSQITLGQPQITQVDFTGLTGANFVTAGPGLSYIQYYGMAGYGVWFNTGTETQPDLSSHSIGNYIAVSVNPANNANELANALLTSINGSGSNWTAAQPVNGQCVITDNINQVDTPAVDINTGAAITVLQTGVAPL